MCVRRMLDAVKACDINIITVYIVFTFNSNLPQNMHKDTNTQGYAILLVQNEYTNSPEGVTRPLKKGSHRTR